MLSPSSGSLTVYGSKYSDALDVGSHDLFIDSRRAPRPNPEGPNRKILRMCTALCSNNTCTIDHNTLFPESLAFLSNRAPLDAAHRTTSLKRILCSMASQAPHDDDIINTWNGAPKMPFRPEKDLPRCRRRAARKKIAWFMVSGWVCESFVDGGVAMEKWKLVRCSTQTGQT